MEKIMGSSKVRAAYAVKLQPVLVIVENERGEILLHKRLGTDQWQLPEGMKMPGKALEAADLEQLYAEPGLHLAQLSFYRMFSREDFSSYYSDGDETFNENEIYMAKSYFGYLKTRSSGSGVLRFFSLYDLPPALEESSKLIVDAYAADHFWIGG